MSEKLLKWIIMAAGVLCLYGFIAIRSLPVMNSIMVEKMIPEHWDFVKYGELYYFNYISHFKEELPPAQRKYRFSEKHPELEDADILMFGDSYLDISRQTTLPERLNDELGQRVFYHRFMWPHYSNPMCLLDEKSYTNGDSRLVIYETVERNIHFKFDEPYGHGICEPPEETGLMKVKDDLIDLAFPENTEEMYKQVLKRSVFTTRLFGFFSTLKFDLFGYISSKTPVYKTGDEPWLFYQPQVTEEVGSFYYQYSEDEINTYCDNIALLEKLLKEEYNLEMLFMPVPSKYTICHGVVNNDPYNEFLPRIYEGLDRRGVNYVDLYSEFRKHGETIYYGTDTHWNKKGVDLTVDILTGALNAMN